MTFSNPERMKSEAQQTQTTASQKEAAGRHWWTRDLCYVMLNDHIMEMQKKKKRFMWHGRVGLMPNVEVHCWRPWGTYQCSTIQAGVGFGLKKSYSLDCLHTSQSLSFSFLVFSLSGAIGDSWWMKGKIVEVSHKYHSGKKIPMPPVLSLSRSQVKIFLCRGLSF